MCEQYSNARKAFREAKTVLSETVVSPEEFENIEAVASIVTVNYQRASYFMFLLGKQKKEDPSCKEDLVHRYCVELRDFYLDIKDNYDEVVGNETLKQSMESMLKIASLNYSRCMYLKYLLDKPRRKSKIPAYNKMYGVITDDTVSENEEAIEQIKTLVAKL